MKLSPRLAAVFLVLILTPLASGQLLTGSVKNATTNKPASGDEVVLLSLGQGMEEAGRTKADAKGNFSFKLDNAGGPHLVRVIHQGVTYHQMAPPGTPSVEVSVYDVTKKITGLNVVADILRFQAQGNELQGIRVFAVDNTSNPPRTQMNDHNFEFYLPDGAQVDSGMAQTEGGQPLTLAPVPQSEKNRYAFLFPLRPGETQFQAVFHMAYSGEAGIDLKALYGSQHFVVVLPKSMQFAADPGAAFKSMKDPRQPDAAVQVASDTQPGQPLGFKISGTGLLSDSSSEAQGSGTAPTAGRDSRPGGGLGPPIDAPDPLEKYRWYILGGFAVVLAAGAIYIARRPNAERMAAMTASMEVEIPSAKPVSVGHSGRLLDALKEEIFQLEVEHKQGLISQQEYEKAKAALDQTLERAVKRGTARIPQER